MEGSQQRGLEGTVLWMAPEVISRSHYSVGSDVWALACTIIEMATSMQGEGFRSWVWFRFMLRCRFTDRG